MKVCAELKSQKRFKRRFSCYWRSRVAHIIYLECGEVILLNDAVELALSSLLV